MLLAPGRDKQIAKSRTPYTGYFSSRRKIVLYKITDIVTVDCKISFTAQTLTAFSERNFQDTLDYIELSEGEASICRCICTDCFESVI